MAKSTAIVTAKASRLTTLIYELFDEDSDKNDELECIGSEAAKQFGPDAEMLRAATDFHGPPEVALRDMDALSADSEHPLLKALEMSMTALRHHQLVQISAQCNHVQAAGNAAQPPTAVPRAAHPLPGLTILRGALSGAQQLDVASAILRCGCLAGEGRDDGTSSIAAGDPTTATAAAEGCGGSGRPLGVPNQAMFFGDLPAWATHLTELLPLDELLPANLASRQPSFDQAIVNLYRPGEGICSHVDLARFQDGIVGVSIGGPAIMHFTRCGPRVGGSCSGGGGAYGSGLRGSGAGCGGFGREPERPAAQPVEGEAGAEQEAKAPAEGLRAKEAPTGPALKRPRRGPDGADGFRSEQRLQQWPAGASPGFMRQDQQRLFCDSGLPRPPTASDSGSGLSAAGTDCPIAITCFGGGGGDVGMDASGTVRPESQLRGAGDGGSLDEGVWRCNPDHFCVLLQGGDLLGMAGEARYGWEHGIQPVVTELLGETGCETGCNGVTAAAAAASAGCRDVPTVTAVGCCGLRSDGGLGTGPEELEEPGAVGGAAGAAVLVVTGSDTAPGGSGAREAGHRRRKDADGESGGGTTVAAAAGAVVAGGGVCGCGAVGPVPIPVARGVRLSITLRRLCPDIVLCEM